jgi:hypothetical protein
LAALNWIARVGVSLKPFLYQEAFPNGTTVRIADRSYLENFLATWKYHHKLSPEQLPYADSVVVVASVGFYHGGDVLYSLEGVPGTWHEACLRPYPDPQP